VLCFILERQNTSSNVSRLVSFCQTSERTAVGRRGRPVEGMMHCARKPQIISVHHKQATLRACKLTCWSALSIRSQFASTQELFPGSRRVYIAVLHSTIARPHDSGPCSCVESKVGVHLTKFLGHAGSIFVAKMHLSGPPLHMLCAVRHVSYILNVRGPTREENVM
jgi:hypothetical protein